MYAQKGRSEEARKLRKKGGAYLKSLRERAGLTQRELAEKVGLDYYTFISQLENGTGRVPPALLTAFADALGVPRREFAKNLLKYYDLFYYQALFERQQDVEDGGTAQPPSLSAKTC